MKKSYIKPENRKKILLICDDIRAHSGVATVAREIVIHTSHVYNWVQIAGSIKHKERGQIIDISQEVNKHNGIEDASVLLYPQDGYGNADILRGIMNKENPDALLLITDPRYFKWLFDMAGEIRSKVPIAYLNIWDDFPVPMYNKPYYESCDLLMGISKQTKYINQNVLKSSGIPFIDLDDKNNSFTTESQRSCPIITKYVPHGLNHNIFRPLPSNDKRLNEIKKQIFKNKNPEFVAFFNSRNIRRKQIPDTMMAFRYFLDGLPEDKAKNCYIILHTELVSDAGTDLEKVREYLFEEKYPENVMFSTKKLSSEDLNCLYNIADVQVLATSNEGWGLTITEAILAGTPIIANVTGGMQDQMRFLDNKNKWFVPNDNVPSNHRGTYKKHGEWAFPVYPTSRSIQGSPITPYIFDDRCKWEDITDRLHEVYNHSGEELQELGEKGREWAISNEAGFTYEHQAERVIESFTELFNTWEPKEKFELINTNDYKGRTLNHKYIY